MATIRYKKRGNKWYVYELNQYWDKELKKTETTYEISRRGREKE